MHELAALDRLARPLADLRISVIDRCNFRCPYCMPEESYPRDHAFMGAAARLSVSEITRLAGIFCGLGVRKLRLTGGEPLLRKDLAEIVASLSRLPTAPDVALTTNGSLLEKMAAPLAAAGLHRITISLDALDPALFAAMSGGRGELGPVLAGIDAAVAAGLSPVKINCVVQRGVNEDQVLPLVEYFRARNRAAGKAETYSLRFIEFMDVGTCNRWDRSAVVPSRDVLARVREQHALEPVEPAYRGEVAVRYRFSDGGGELGFISSVSQPFCGDCTRARLSADGRLYTCLFAAQGQDLRTPLRSNADDAALRAAILGVWRGRADRYSEARFDAALRPGARVEMYRIGG